MEPDAYDLAATAVGVVEADAVLGPDRVRPGDAVVALASSGLHSNGYSLVRRVVRGRSLAEHVPEMLAYRRAARRADVAHFQWLTVQQVDWALLPSGPPRVLTAHDVIPREPRPGQIAATRQLVKRMDAVVVHSETSTATVTDIQAIGELSRDRTCLLAIDAVSSLGAIPTSTSAPSDADRKSPLLSVNWSSRNE